MEKRPHCLEFFETMKVFLNLLFLVSIGIFAECQARKRCFPVAPPQDPSVEPSEDPSVEPSEQPSEEPSEEPASCANCPESEQARYRIVLATVFPPEDDVEAYFNVARQYVNDLTDFGDQWGGVYNDCFTCTDHDNVMQAALIRFNEARDRRG